jgi:steroid 5-alpha reductase family enzyme
MAWGLVFILIAAGTLVYDVVMNQTDIHWGKLLMMALVTIWGARLATHIGHRLKRTTSEDPRYVELRAKWRGNMERNIFFRTYMVQAVLAVIIALPVIFLNSSEYITVPAFVLAGAIVWLVGFLFESTADLQLEEFVTRHPGKLMTSGLWKYSRHPNYFGEMTQWWGLGLMALSVDYGWFSLIGPLVLTFLLLFVSGVPLAEKRAEKREGWGVYKRRTSVIFPLPPT